MIWRSVILAGVLVGSMTQLRAEVDQSSAQKHNWQGPHVGVFAGYGFAGRGADEPIHIGGPKGAIAGVRAGWDLSFGRLVVGLSGDVSSSQIGQSLFGVRGSVPWLASLTGRVGFAIAPTTLIYGSAGLAAGRGEVRFPGLVFAHNHWGIAVGAGVEQRISPLFNLYAEYRYIGLLPKSYAPLPVRLGYEGHVAVVGISFRLK